MAVDSVEYAATCDRLRGLMVVQLAAKGTDFPTAVQHAGRLLPRQVRMAAVRITDLGDRVQNPKLARIADDTALAEDVATVEVFLQRQDPGAQKARARANLLAKLVFQIGVVILLFGAVLWWRGII